jgi:hypothetical protein
VRIPVAERTHGADEGAWAPWDHFEMSMGGGKGLERGGPARVGGVRPRARVRVHREWVDP